ncbi:MAG: histidine ammonia-lyase [bacterium]|nr:histidine ammonia-lyase [bacterium]
MASRQSEVFRYGIDRLTCGQALNISNGKVRALIDETASARVDHSYECVAKIVKSGQAVYGINTGFGPLCTTMISEEETRQLQFNILRSHSAGVGDPLPPHVARLMMVLKVHSLAYGRSGIAPATLVRICHFIDNDICPVVPSQGSVGASGDLAPLAHLFLPLIGLGRVTYKGDVIDADIMLRSENLEPLDLGPKEGLALINGTQFIAANAVIGLDRMGNCLDNADILGAMTLEALLGSTRPFTEELLQLRAYKGCLHVAHRLRELLRGSEMAASHVDCDRVQDPYSLRCMPQVHGAARNAFGHLKEMLEVELNSVTDNPIIVDENTSISGGNFHGQPLALPLDYASIATSELGNISDRRTYLLLDGRDVLPRLLMKDVGVNSGFMIPQYTSAALVTENKSLCFPASADSIPTSLGQEDHVSMGAISSRRLNQIIDNLENILAVELVCAAQAFDFRRPLRSGRILDGCHSIIRERIDHADSDRVFADDLGVARDLIRERALVNESLAVSGRHNLNLSGEHAELFGTF